jgi:hypothetical protein
VKRREQKQVKESKKENKRRCTLVQTRNIRETVKNVASMNNVSDNCLKRERVKKERENGKRQERHERERDKPTKFQYHSEENGFNSIDSERDQDRAAQKKSNHAKKKQERGRGEGGVP